MLPSSEGNVYGLGVLLLLQIIVLVMASAPFVNCIGTTISPRATTSTSYKNCSACVNAAHVWCYHDDVCYAHGDSNDAKAWSCPGSNRCASNVNCACTSCADKKCQPAIPNAPSCGAPGTPCKSEGAYCPPGRPGAANPADSCCTNGHWMAGVCTPPQPHIATGVIEQVHLALGRVPGTMTVAWASAAAVGESVKYGTKYDTLDVTVAGDARPLNVSGWRYTHTATMHDLVPNTLYFYKIGARQDTFNFTYQRARGGDDDPAVHILFGDMGSSHAFALCLGCNASSLVCDAAACARAGGATAGLVAEAGRADLFVHVGDFGYDLGEIDGSVSVGDQFMRNIEQIAAFTPYMVSHGNHEDSAASLAHFVERFRSQPSNAVPAFFTSDAGTTTNTMYFSWDAGLVHYIALSTELWFGVSSPNTGVDRVAALAWLEADLIAANANRERVPWIIAHGHRDIYCSTGDDNDCAGAALKVRADLEPLFFKYGLDIWLNAHEHSYERTVSAR